MGTVDWRKLRSFAAVMALIAAASATTMISCGGGGGSPDGKLCQQCGETDGPCISPTTIEDDETRPSFCPTNGTCNVRLLCVRKLDSGQRRCFPADTNTNQLDVDYECDGSRPDTNGVPTTSPTPTLTPTPLASTTPTSTAPTPTPTGPTPTPSPTPTTIPVTINVEVSDDFEGDEDPTSAFVVTVTYKDPSKGNFRNGDVADCKSEDEPGLTPQDDANGTLRLNLPSNPDRTFPVAVDCVFHQVAGKTLVDSDLSASPNSGDLTVEIDELDVARAGPPSPRRRV